MPDEAVFWSPYLRLLKLAAPPFVVSLRLDAPLTLKLLYRCLITPELMGLRFYYLESRILLIWPPLDFIN